MAQCRGPNSDRPEKIAQLHHPEALIFVGLNQNLSMKRKAALAYQLNQYYYARDQENNFEIEHRALISDRHFK